MGSIWKSQRIAEEARERGVRSEAQGGSRFKRLVEVSQMVIAVSCVGVFFNAGTSAAAQNLCVDPSNTPKCSATIQDAVDLAKKNAVITVVAGTFFENVVINTGMAPKKLNLVIQGAGVGSTIVDGGSAGIVFTVGRKAALTLANMTIQHGENTASQGLGGGVSAVGTKLTIQDCEINDNVVTDGGGGGVGVEAGPLNVINSTVRDNNASGGGGLFFASAKKTATISDSTFRDNLANEGGGILIGGLAKATIRNSTIDDNQAAEVGLSPAIGGGIFVDGKSVTILDSTISDNLARTDQPMASHGGGICNLNSTVTLNNVTVADNAASVGGGIDTQASMSFITSGNSIIADNRATVSSADCAGNVKSTGYNLILDPSGCGVSGKTSTDIISEDPILADLAPNPPGMTDTQALGAGSPALEKGNPGAPEATACRPISVAYDDPPASAISGPSS